MKFLLIVPLIGILVAAGCEKNQPVTPQTTNAVVPGPAESADYGSALANAQNRAIAVVDTSSLKSAIQLFNAQEGRYPKDLDELVSSKMIGKIPPAPRGKKLDYNPATGEIKIVDQ